MKEHRLKTHPDPFNSIASGLKLHEVRRADRDFQPGDAVVLECWRGDDEGYTGHSISATIGHVTAPRTWGLPDGLCVFSLLNVVVRR